MKEIDIKVLSKEFPWLNSWYKEGKEDDLDQKIIAYEIHPGRSKITHRIRKYMVALLKQESNSDKYWKYLFTVLTKDGKQIKRSQFRSGIEALVYYTKEKESLINSLIKYENCL